VVVKNSQKSICVYFSVGERCIYTIHVFKTHKVIKVRDRSPYTRDTENKESWRSSELIPLELSNCKRPWETEAAFPTTETTIVLYLYLFICCQRFSFLFCDIGIFENVSKKKSEISRIYTTKRISQIVFWQKKSNKISPRNWLLYLSTPSWEIS